MITRCFDSFDRLFREYTAFILRIAAVHQSEVTVSRLSLEHRDLQPAIIYPAFYISYCTPGVIYRNGALLFFTGVCPISHDSSCRFPFVLSISRFVADSQLITSRSPRCLSRHFYAQNGTRDSVN